jgi:hypothetical protein
MLINSGGIDYEVIDLGLYRRVPRVGAFLFIRDFDQTKFWIVNGMEHRTDGPAIEWPSGYKEWCLNGVLHRLDGPAVEEPDGSKSWYLNGVRHRTDGPAKEWPDGYKEWYINGKNLSYSEWRRERKIWIQMEIKEKIKDMII